MTLEFWVVSPDAALAARWEAALRRESWLVRRAAGIDEQLSTAPAGGRPAIALVDWDALAPSPLSAISRLRSRLSGLSIILTGPAGLANARVIELLEAGVDDFIPHGVDEGVLRAKLRAHLRRLLPSLASALDVLRDSRGELKLDRSRWELRTRGKDGKWSSNTRLTRTELELLALFLERPGAAIDRRFIVDAVWKDEAEAIQPGTVDKHVESLRKKLGPLGARIQTVYGVGYAFREEGI